MTDPGLIMMTKEHFPDAEIHLSTQANNTNWAQVKFWKDYGIKRAILARELRVDEIKEIHEQVPDIELEAFVHGSIYMAYSSAVYFLLLATVMQIKVLVHILVVGALK